MDLSVFDKSRNNILKSFNNEGVNTVVDNSPNNTQKISVRSKNEIKKQRDIIIKEYMKDNNICDVYYIASTSLSKMYTYIVLKYSELGNSSMQIKVNELPRGANIGSVLTLKNTIYHIEQEITKEINKKINTMFEEVLNQQNKELQAYRKEGHIYTVEEDANGRTYLFDVTEQPDYAIEEVDFPSELLSCACEGAKFKYVNGQYVLCSKE